MRSSKLSILAPLGLLLLLGTTGCGPQEWHALQVGRSKGVDVEVAFKTPVTPEDRYAYAFSQGKFTRNTVLLMVDLDENGIVVAKYYWHSVPRPLLPFWRRDTWEMALETEIAPTELQEYSLTLGPREDAILAYFGRRLFDTARHFPDLDEVIGPSTSMNRILAKAVAEYNRQAAKQTLLGGDGFIFDAGLYGSKCTMQLKAADPGRGLYTLVLKGYHNWNFSSGG